MAKHPSISMVITKEQVAPASLPSELVTLAKQQSEYGIDEVNFGRMPHTVPPNCPIQRDQRGNPFVVVRSRRWDESTKQMVDQEFRMSSATELPNDTDKDNLMALQAYALKTGQIHNKEIRCPASALLAIKHRSDGGDLTAAVKQSMDRYRNVKYEYINCWWDKTKKNYAKKYSTGILASYGESSKRKGDSDNELIGVWNPDYHDSLLRNYVLFDDEVYFSLPRGACRNAFTFIKTECDLRGNWLRIWTIFTTTSCA